MMKKNRLEVVVVRFFSFEHRVANSYRNAIIVLAPGLCSI